MPTARHVQHWAGGRSLGIDLGGASSDTTGYAVLEAGDRPKLLAAGRPSKGSNPREAEQRLVDLIDEWQPAVVAIDAPLTLPPCLTCPSYCRGPGELCELGAANRLWDRNWNAVSQRECELHISDHLHERPLPTMQLGVITARAVALANRLATRGTPPSVMERGEVLEVYPKATLRQLAVSNPSLAPRQKGEEPDAYRKRVLSALAQRIDNLGAHADALQSGHVFDGLIAAYTGWLSPTGLQPPPDNFNVASGWIWYPHHSA